MAFLGARISARCGQLFAHLGFEGRGQLLASDAHAQLQSTCAAMHRHEDDASDSTLFQVGEVQEVVMQSVHGGYSWIEQAY